MSDATSLSVKGSMCIRCDKRSALSHKYVVGQTQTDFPNINDETYIALQVSVNWLNEPGWVLNCLLTFIDDQPRYGAVHSCVNRCKGKQERHTAPDEGSELDHGKLKSAGQGSKSALICQHPFSGYYNYGDQHAGIAQGR